MRWITWQIAGWLHAATCAGMLVLWQLTKLEEPAWLALLSFACAVYCWYTHMEEQP